MSPLRFEIFIFEAEYDKKNGHGEVGLSICCGIAEDHIEKFNDKTKSFI